MDVSTVMCVVSGREAMALRFTFGRKHTVDVFIVICVVPTREDADIAFCFGGNHNVHVGVVICVVPARNTPALRVTSATITTLTYISICVCSAQERLGIAFRRAAQCARIYRYFRMLTREGPI